MDISRVYLTRADQNTEEMIRTIREIREYGVNVFFVVENINSLEFESEHIITIIEAFREEENRVRSENIRMGLKAGALSGKSGLYSRRCYGYRKGDDGELQIVPEEANVVRTIYSVYLEGASINKIAAYLKVKGIKSPTGKENWCCRTIDVMLSNEKYYGYVILMKSISSNGIGSRRIKNTGEGPR